MWYKREILSKHTHNSTPRPLELKKNVNFLVSATRMRNVDSVPHKNLQPTPSSEKCYLFFYNIFVWKKKLIDVSDFQWLRNLEKKNCSTIFFCLFQVSGTMNEKKIIKKTVKKFQPIPPRDGLFHSTNVPFDQCSIRPMFHSTNVPFDQSLIRPMFLRRKCIRRKCIRRKCFRRKCFRRKCRIPTRVPPWSWNCLVRYIRAN